MQLILDTEPTIDIKRNMSTLNEETLSEKVDDVIEDLKSGLCNGNKENIQCQENNISSVEEPNYNEKVEEIIAAKSPTLEQSVDTILKPADLTENTETTVKSPNAADVTETVIKSPEPDDITDTTVKTLKPDEHTAKENVIPDYQQSVSDIVASDGTGNEKLDINIKDVEITNNTISNEDISLKMEDKRPAFVDDQINNDEESDPIIISHDETSCLNGQKDEIIEKNEVTQKSDDIIEEINEKDQLNRNIDVNNVEIAGKKDVKVDENMEVVDQVNEETTHFVEGDTTCLNGLKEAENDESINEVEDEKMEEVVDGICPSGKDQDVPKTIDDVKMQEDTVKNDIQSTNLRNVDIITEVNNELTSNSCDVKIPNEKDVTEKSSSEIDTNIINNSVDLPKEIETVDLDDEEKETENADKSLTIENSASQLNVHNSIENDSVSDKNENSVAEMETVDLIDEKDGSGLESMDVDINGENGEPEEKAISLSSEKEDIFDCEDNLDEVVPIEETLTDKTENIELKNNVTSMDEDVQPVDDENSHKSFDTKKEEAINIQDDEVKERESISEEPAKEVTQTSSQSSKATDETKTTPPVIRLSNTLDILSDDEDGITEPPKTETPPQNTEVESAVENKCINIEDDDDIMLIDEEDNSKESKSEPAKPEAQSSNTEPKEDIQESEKKVDVESSENLSENPEKITESPSEKSTIDKEKPKDEKDENISEAKTEPIKPLVPTNFLKTCKKNMAEMTRDDLEEFCILKIVESVVDRSSLSEIKSKLKSMAQGIEEYKKKAQMLQKQNRDLQVVLKTIQEEQKNSKTVTPLKITRSVGMQVLMTERSTIRRKQPGPGPNTTPTKTQSPRTPNQRTMKVPAAPSPQQIPVPRLVPASISPAAKNNIPQVNATASKAASPVNGVRNITQKAEKRTINRNHSVTVDLTDDEPPTKIMNRNSTPTPLRVVPPHMVPQNLLAATPRHPIAQNNNPRKVYIPISGPQNQNVRAGQAIMLKSVTAPNQTPRPRGPQPHMTRMPQNQVRMTRIQNRHPAPLPESTKQYPGTYLKALPPAPDLKLSKVENGIVISWKIEGYQEDSYEEIASYQLYAYQETNSPPSTALWKKIGDVKALPLPMACTLTQFMAGFKYYFAVRAVDIRSRIGPFSLPGSILLLNKL